MSFLFGKDFTEFFTITSSYINFSKKQIAKRRKYVVHKATDEIGYANFIKCNIKFPENQIFTFSRMDKKKATCDCK